MPISAVNAVPSPRVPTADVLFDSSWARVWRSLSRSSCFVNAVAQLVYPSKGSVAPPTRNAQASARLPQATVTPAASSSEPVITSLREEIETPSAGEMMSALARMNASSALMAAKAFGIATALVVAGAGGLAWTVRTTMDVHDVRAFVITHCFPCLLTHCTPLRYASSAARCASSCGRAMPSLTARIHRAPETEEERRQLDHRRVFGSRGGVELEKAQRRLELALQHWWVHFVGTNGYARSRGRGTGRAREKREGIQRVMTASKYCLCFCIEYLSLTRGTCHPYLQKRLASPRQPRISFSYLCR